MSEFRIKSRATGAKAEVERFGAPIVTSATGGSLYVVTGSSDPGFNPIDLLYASLSACLVLSARIAASKLGVLDRFVSASAEVSGEKAGDERTRVARIRVVFDIVGDFDEALRAEIAHKAEEICTVSNTLQRPPEIEVALAGR